MELMFEDDPVIIAETEDLLMQNLLKWNRCSEFKGPRVNIDKT